MILATDAIGMSILLDPALAGSLLTSFNADRQNLVTYCREAGSPPDVLFDGAYFGANVHPYETVFMKANRGVSEATLKLMTELHLNQSWTSWDSCG